MLRSATIFVTITFLHSWQATAQPTGCSITFPKPDDRNQPIILVNHKKKYNLFVPENGKANLKSGETIELFCPNTKNTLTQSKTNFTTATCTSQENLKIKNLNYRFNELQCSSPPKASITPTNTACGNNRGKIVHIGYKLPNDNWITIIQACYDENEGNALYAEHTIYGQAIKYASTQQYRPSFSETGVTKNLKADDAYKQTNQKKIFTKVLGSESLANKYLYKNSYLDRGHLAPDADFLFPGLQFATYFFINTCPQWENLNRGNWLAIENMVRKVAERYQKPLRIITGSHGVLSLPDVNNNLQNIFLDSRGKLPIPKFLWKIIYNEGSKEAIALVAVNDPFIKEMKKEELLCPDICSQYGWDSNKWKNIAKGYVYCCDVKLLQKTFQTIPSLNIRGILKASI